jgi:hypothetical protein
MVRSADDDAGPLADARVEGQPLTVRFERAFRERSALIRRRLALRWVLGGAAIGAMLGAGLGGVAWWTRHGGARLVCLGLPLVGALVGLGMNRRRRWSDEHVALFLDRGLASHEVIVTALEMRAQGRASASSVLRGATEALERPLPEAAKPRFVRPWHSLALVGTSIGVWVASLALPPPPVVAAPPPGLETVQLEDLEGLEETRRLVKLEARDAAQRDRLRALSERAEKLERALSEGMPHREAQAEVSRLRDDVAAERRLGTGEQRKGLESALGKLAKNADLERVQRALGDRDFTRLDEEMERLANRLEDDDRRRAMDALAEAAEAARRDGAEGVARMLEQQRKRLAEHGAGAEALRELADALGGALSPEGQRALEEMKQGGSRESREALGRELAKALEALGDEERKRLAEQLKRRMKALRSDRGAPSMSDEQLEALRKRLETPEGRAEWLEQLRRLAADPLPSDEAQRDGMLEDAERQLGEGEQRLQQPMPLPMPMAGAPSGRKDGNGKPGAKPGDGQGEGAPGGAPGTPEGAAQPGRGGGPGQHGGTTGKLDGDALRARANAQLNPGPSNPGVSMGRTTGRAGETARTGGTGRLGEVAPGELSDVGRSEIPEEYREQVGRYFPAR